MAGRSPARSLALVLLMGLAACSGRPNVFNEPRDMRLARLEVERAELARATGAVERTRIQIRISDLMISFMGDAVADGDLERFGPRMEEYWTAILDARETMMSSGRDPSRDSVYRELEIAIRQQIGHLDDIGARMTLADREPLNDLIVRMTEIRTELLEAIFPEPDEV